MVSSHNLESHYFQATKQESRQMQAEHQSEQAYVRVSHHEHALDKQGSAQSMYDDQQRLHTTQGGRRKSSRSPKSKKARSTNKSQGNAFNSQTSSFDRRSNNSKSPEVRKVMERLTHHRVKIDSETKLLING